jgi:CheY-like chemotaxis protein
LIKLYLQTTENVLRIGFVTNFEADYYVFQDLIEEIADSTLEVDYFESTIQLLKKLETMGDFYDILFLDINMPEMDGFDFLQELEEEYEEHSENAFIYLLTAQLFSKRLRKIRSFS